MFRKLSLKLRTQKEANQSNSYLEKNESLLEQLNQQVKEQDKQFNRLLEGLERAGDNLDEKIKVYEEIIMNEGMIFHGGSHLRTYLDLLYKKGDFDKLWATLNTYAIKYPHMLHEAHFQITDVKF